MSKEYSLVIQTKHLFDGITDATYEGYLCLQGKQIIKVGKGKISPGLKEKAEKFLEFDKELVMPGIVDTHTFFTGYTVFHLGADFSKVRTNGEGKDVLKTYAKKKIPCNVLFGHGWNPDQWNKADGEQMLEKEFPNQPVIIFANDRGSCMMNEKAREVYQFTSDSCYPESYFRIMKEYLNDREFISKELNDYATLLNSRGVTTVKEMGFDDFYGFTDYLKEIEDSENLHLRFFFMSQPVGEPMNLPYAKRMMKQFTGDKIRFSGFNRMTDGTIADYHAELKTPYENRDFVCDQNIPWDEIEKDVLAADKEGFRWSLHAQGDGAVGKVAQIYNKCKMEHGKLVNRHSLTDMEFTAPEDLEKLGEMGVSAELYFQIMSLDPGSVLKENIKRTIGMERGKNYWNRRKMEDSGMNLCGATDLPLMITNVPESIYYSCGGYLDGVDEPFQTENTLSAVEILKAWTIGGQKNLGMEEKLGTLEEGKIADIAIFDRDLTTEDPKTVKDASVVLTILEGNIVYQL